MRFLNFLKNERVFQILRKAVLVCPLVVLTGCFGKSPPPIVEVKGTVLLNGKPLSKAKVQFIPQIDFGPEYIAMGLTDENGQFQLTCMGQSGACACTNLVTIHEQDVPDELLLETAQAKLKAYRESLKNRPIPMKYASLAKTPLKVEVTADKQQYDFTLSR
ncbi:MAG: hypothetical protein ACFCD0_04450 [Gemmataceae bacterium]